MKLNSTNLASHLAQVPMKSEETINRKGQQNHSWEDLTRKKTLIMEFLDQDIIMREPLNMSLDLKLYLIRRDNQMNFLQMINRKKQIP